MPASPPETFADWVVVAHLGDGGMARTFLVAKRMGSRVKLAALKTPLVAGHEAMFRDEASVLCSFEHPFIVRGIEFGRTPAGQLYLAMDYVDGAELRSLNDFSVKRGRLLTQNAVGYVGICIAKALDYCHHLYDCEESPEGVFRPVHVGAVHRDCTLANIFVASDGRVLLGDFGIAVFRGREENLTRVGFKANVGYLPPDLARICEKIDSQRSLSPDDMTMRDALYKDPSYDIYLLGESLYRLLHGRAPYPNTQARLRGERAEIRTDIEEAFGALIAGMLSPDPQARPNAPDIIDRLRRIFPDISRHQDELADIVQEFQATSAALPETPEYERVPLHKRLHVQRREQALRALRAEEESRQATKEYHSPDHTDPALLTWAPAPRIKPERKPKAPKLRWAIAALAITAVAGSALAIRTTRGPAPSSSQTPQREASDASTETSVAGSRMAAHDIQQALVGVESVTRNEPHVTGDPLTVAIPAPITSNSAPKAVETGEAGRKRSKKAPPSSPDLSCTLLIEDLVDYSNNNTRVDGNRAAPEKLAGRASIMVAAGRHRVEIHRDDRIDTKWVDVTRSSCPTVQFGPLER